MSLYSVWHTRYLCMSSSEEREINLKQQAEQEVHSGSQREAANSLSLVFIAMIYSLEADSFDLQLFKLF